jgi:hypothetical protein
MPTDQDYDLYRSVRRYWIGAGLRPSTPDLAGPRKRGVSVPADYERFVGIAGVPVKEDSNGFLFWQPDALRRVVDALDDVDHPDASDNQAIVFADYLQESWLYALSHDDGESDVLIVRGAVYPHHRIGTFREFLTWYLEDNERLYSGPIAT